MQYIEWFTHHGQAGVVEIRGDLYDSTFRTGFGVKRRDGGPLEVKRLMGSARLVRVDTSLTGTLEEWRKTIAPQVDVREGESTSGWVEVEKAVLTRRFQLLESKGIVAVDVVEDGGSGCDVELASVTVGGRHAWTYAFEAYGPVDSRLEAIRRSAAAVTAGAGYPPGFISDLTLSVGYPEWLSYAEPTTFLRHRSSSRD